MFFKLKKLFAIYFMKLLSRGSQMAPLDLGGSIVSMLPRLLKLLLTPSERRGNPLTARG